MRIHAQNITDCEKARELGLILDSVQIEKIALEPYNRDFTGKDQRVYKWGRDFQKYLGKDEYGRNKYDSVNPPYPDHAILIAEIEI